MLSAVKCRVEPRLINGRGTFFVVRFGIGLLSVPDTVRLVFLSVDDHGYYAHLPKPAQIFEFLASAITNDLLMKNSDCMFANQNDISLLDDALLPQGSCREFDGGSCSHRAVEILMRNTLMEPVENQTLS